MCDRCDQQVKEMDIRDSDLPMLPYKTAKWKCIVPGCKGGCTVRDYGIAPLYHWPVRLRRDRDGCRGGWVDATNHWYMCSRHFKHRDRMIAAIQHRFSDEFFLSRNSYIIKR